MATLSSTAIMMATFCGITKDRIEKIHTEAAPIIKTAHEMAQIANMVEAAPPAQALNLLGALDSRLAEVENQFDSSKTQFAQNVKETVYLPLQAQFANLDQQHDTLKRKASTLIAELNQVLPKIREGLDAGKTLSEIKAELNLDQFKFKQKELDLAPKLEALNTTLNTLQPSLTNLVTQINNLAGPQTKPTIPLTPQQGR
jgi:chromosome segregation ATPase